MVYGLVVVVCNLKVLIFSNTYTILTIVDNKLIKNFNLDWLFR